MNVLDLCSGVGGLSLGLHLALGGWARTVGYVERDAYAAAVLLARMDDAALDRAPVWDDITTFDAGPWRGVVDLVAAGFPCQPWSVAGKRKGTADSRWIWPEIARIVRECEPGFVFLENVPGLYRHGLRAVLSDLAALGFDADWTCVSASEVGAPHKRERVFILAHRASGGLGDLRELSGGEGQPDGGDEALEDAARLPGREWPGRERVLKVGTEPLAHRDESGPGGERIGGLLDGERAPQRDDADGRGADVGDAEHSGTSGHQGSHEPQRPLGGLGFPPGPGDAEGWRAWIAAGGPEPVIRRSVDGLPSRLDRLRCLGNAVVPQQAAAALTELLARIA